jgi:hypothetical protein
MENHMRNTQNELNANALLTLAELDEVSGGRMKIPGTGLERYEVYYDDGVSILTNKPGCSNVYPTIT